MSDEASVAVGGEVASAAPAQVTTQNNDSPLSVGEAFEAYKNRTKRDDETTEGAVESAATDPRLADEANAAPPEEATGETQDGDPAETQPLDRPRSWSKEKEAVWTRLDRDIQQFLLEHDSEVSKGVRKAQNEAAEIRKAIDAERVQVEEARKTYEAKIPAIMQALQDAQAGEFPDIKTMDDVKRLAAEDPFRYLQWDGHQKLMQAVAFEADQANQRKATEEATSWQNFQKEESQKAAELYPELADPVKSEKLAKAAADLFRDKGFTENELAKMARGEKFSPWDHRLQAIIVDAVKYRELQHAKPQALSKTPPAVQRPGVAQPRGAKADANVQALDNRLNKTGSVKDAYALYQARRAAG